MWRKSVLRIADDIASLSCAIVPAHPWVYGLGQTTDSGGYLSPANALAYLAKKLIASGGNSDVIILMIAENTHDIFMQGLNNLAAVFPAPAFTQVSRMAKAAAELSAVKMQLPAKAANGLPAAVPLSVPTNRAAVNAQRVAVTGDWERQTDQTIKETSMTRVIQADDENRTLVVRETTIQATDKTTVLGTATLLAGAVLHVSEGDYSIGTAGNLTVSCKNVKRSIGANLDDTITGNAMITVGAALTEKITGIRRSVAQAQQLIAPVIRLGTDEVNVLTLLTDTLDVVNELAKLTASHTHPNTGTSQQSGNFTAAAAKTDALKTKYGPLIA